MFGQIKENIFYGFQVSKGNPDELKTRFNNYVSALKGSPSLKRLHEVYQWVEEASFDTDFAAYQFIDECLATLTDINKVDLKRLSELTTENVNTNISERTAALDQLLFNENLNIKEKHDQKTLLIKQLTKTKEKKVDYKEMITNLDKKVSTTIPKLTTEQKEALEVFMEKDDSKISSYYGNLIESTIDLIENRLLNEDNVEINKSLIATKKRLQGLKDQAPTIDAVDSIIELKNDISAA